MKTNVTRIFALAIIAVFVSMTLANAADTLQTKKAKIKTTVTNSESKESVETIVSLLKGVKESKLDAETKVLCVEYNPDQISTFMLVYTIQNLGHSAEVLEDNYKTVEGEEIKAAKE